MPLLHLFLCACLCLVGAGVLHKADESARSRTARLAEGGSVIKYRSPLDVLKDTYDHSCC